LLTPDDDAVPSACVVNLDNIQTVQKHQIGALITTLSSARMADVERALCFALGMDRLLGKF
jgi:mRNA-degrading endonuclease toxin of MazEF toxin-antitoxin module